MYYSEKTKAMYYDCDANNRLKLSAAMRYMQQASSDQLEAIGIPTNKLLKENMVFLLSKSCIKIHRMPVAAEPLLIGTAPTALKGARFAREFVIDSEAGERLISAFTLWLLVDPASRKILRPASFPYPLQLEESFVSQDVGDIMIPKMTLPVPRTAGMEVEIRYSHLDSNAHVNNSVYADFICDALEYDDMVGRGIDTVAIGFYSEAKRGDRLLVERVPVEQGEYYLGGSHDSLCFEALVRLR